MSLVLLAAGAFVYWRITFALDRQLDQDLRDYSDTVERAVRSGDPLPADDPGEVAQTYSRAGMLLANSDRGVRRLVAAAAAASATSTPRVTDLERLVPPPSQTPYRVRYRLVGTPGGEVVLATGISRNKHDEALRELVGQLAIADLVTILAAALVGWGATRAALGPVERYRRAAVAAGGDPTARLPVESDRNDELARLGATFNNLLDEIEAGQLRERQFLADASHELRSPLALLSAEVEWVRHRPRTKDETDRVLTSIAEQTTRLAGLADALLDLEEATVGSPIRTEQVALDQLLHGAVASYLHNASMSGRSIVVSADQIEVAVEPRWIDLAVGNLIANALKHGRGRIEVAGHETPSTIQIVVTDEGGGIPPAFGSNAFERFARADTARTTPGNGLGLAIVAAVARRHGGTAELVPRGVCLEMPKTRSTSIA